MCVSEGLALAPWGALGGGRFKTDEEIAAYEKSGEQTRTIWGEGFTDKSRAVTKVLDKIAKAKGSTKTGVALSYVMQKVPYVFPIVGGRKPEHLAANIEALGISLTAEQILAIESVKPFEKGFPYTNFVSYGSSSSQSPG